jgi:hypothetical protein
MTAEEILIDYPGDTETSYASCGDSGCTLILLRCIGVKEKDAAEYWNIDIHDLGGGTTLRVYLLQKSGSCEWCAACGEFIRHGIKYSNGEGGCEHDPEVDAPDRTGQPHVDFEANPLMRAWHSYETR